MLYICVPTYNEAPTIGVLLWRLRKTFQDYSREYEVLVYDDGSTDSTSDVLTPYANVLPLTVLRGARRGGYGQALQALCKEAARRTHYARRDAMIVMQGDFTDQPEMIPELVKSFEGGADIVVAERSAETMPTPVRRLSRMAPWAIRPFVTTKGVADPFNSFRLYRLSLLREFLKSAGPDTSLITTDGWAANVELLVKLMPLARRIERVRVVPRYDLRPRESRIRPMPDAWSLYKYTKQSRRWRSQVPA